MSRRLLRLMHIMCRKLWTQEWQEALIIQSMWHCAIVAMGRGFRNIQAENDSGINLLASLR